jgi:aryl-alcohol dehydrogenase-like predicted oxidoreductase
LDIADVVREIATEMGVIPSQVALAWVLHNPAVVSPSMGARTLAQAEDNFGALDIVFTDEQYTRLQQASAIEPIFPDRFVSRPMVQQLIFGGTTVKGSK